MLDAQCNKFIIEKHPIVSVSNTGSIFYFECLSRWIDQSGKIHEAAYFIPMLRELNALRNLDGVVLIRALEELRSNPGIRLGVNISPKELCDDRFWKEALIALQDNLDICGNLIIEITEDHPVNINRTIYERFSHLKDMDIIIGIDDFGEGFSQKKYLINISEYIDFVKIGKNVLDSAIESRMCRNELDNILMDARSLSENIVFEGVEDEAQLDYVRSLNVPFVQGYLVTGNSNEGVDRAH